MSAALSFLQSAQPPAAQRGVYKYRGKLLGRNAYYAVTSDGRMVGDGLRTAGLGKTDAEVVTGLYCELDQAERPKPRLLADGPLVAVYDESAEAVSSDQLTRRIYTHLYRSIYGTDPAWPPDEALEA